MRNAWDYLFDAIGGVIVIALMAAFFLWMGRKS